MPLPRQCTRCNERYQPTGKRQKICAKCLRKSQLEVDRSRRRKT